MSLIDRTSDAMKLAEEWKERADDAGRLSRAVLNEGGKKMSKPDPKPIFLVKPNTISKEDIKRAERMASVCIVECTEPEAARFLVPPPLGDISAQGVAALRVLQWVATNANGTVYRSDLTNYFTRLILEQAKPVLPVKQ